MTAGARSIAIEGVGLALGFGVALAVAWLWTGQDAADQAFRIAWHRTALTREPLPDGEHGPVVLWMGDSTMLFGRAFGYPEAVENRLAQSNAGVLHRHFVVPAFDPFHFYYVMGRALRLDPDLIVIGASLRSFTDDTLSAPRNDLCSEIPVSEIPRAMTLPLEQRGVTLPRLLLCPVLKSERIADLAFRLEGVRGILQERLGFESTDTRLAGAPQRIDRDLEAVEGIAPDRPAVAMLLASLEMAQRRGAKVLVVVSPVNARALAPAGYDDAVFADRIALLRRLVAERGAAFVDLHDAVPPEGFMDPWGHMNLRGIPFVARPLSAAIAEELDLTPPSP